MNRIEQTRYAKLYEEVADLRASLAAAKSRADRAEEELKSHIGKQALKEMLRQMLENAKKREAIEAHVERLRTTGDDLIDAIRRPMGAAVWTCVERFELALAATPAASLAKVKAETLRELIAECDRRRNSIIRAFGDVSAGDVLGIALEMADRLESEAGA